MEENMEMTLEAAAAPAAEVTAVTAEPAVRPLPEQELVDFVREHPGLDSRTIPGSVWEAVKRGESLNRAYGRHELQQLRNHNQQLQRQLGLLQRSAADRQRSLGSMRSTGSSYTADSFLAGFNEE